MQYDRHARALLRARRPRPRPLEPQVPARPTCCRGSPTTTGSGGELRHERRDRPVIGASARRCGRSPSEGSRARPASRSLPLRCGARRGRSRSLAFRTAASPSGEARVRARHAQLVARPPVPGAIELGSQAARLSLCTASSMPATLRPPAVASSGESPRHRRRQRRQPTGSLRWRRCRSPWCAATTRATRSGPVTPTRPDGVDTGVVAHGDGKVAQLAGFQAVTPGDDDPTRHWCVRARLRPASSASFRSCSERRTRQLLLERALAGEHPVDGERKLSRLGPQSLRGAPRGSLPKNRSRASEAWPVTASIRRVFEAMERSETIRSGPIIPRAETCVPPQSSTEACPASTTRTTSPYFSPKNAIAPALSASSRELTLGLAPARRSAPRRSTRSSTRPISSSDQRAEVAEVETQPVRRHERPLLADVVAEHLAEGPVEDVGAGVVSPDGVPALASIAATRLLADLDSARRRHSRGAG